MHCWLLLKLNLEGILLLTAHHSDAATESLALILTKPPRIALRLHGLANLLHIQCIGNRVAIHNHTTTQERTREVLQCVLRNGEEHAESLLDHHLILRIISRLLPHIRHLLVSLGHLQSRVLLTQRVQALHHIVVCQVNVLNHHPRAILHCFHQRSRSEHQILLPSILADGVSSNEGIRGTVVVQEHTSTRHSMHLGHTLDGVGLA